jgi:hypothetical protein
MTIRWRCLNDKAALACNFIRDPPVEVGTAWQPSASREARMNNLLRNYS